MGKYTLLAFLRITSMAHSLVRKLTVCFSLKEQKDIEIVLIKVYFVTATKTLQKTEDEDQEKIKSRVVTLMCKRNEAI